MDAPPALPAHAVTLLLSHLSRLDDGLPPHLISTPLRQRHHFLGLGDVLDTAQDAATYLSWPPVAGSGDDALRVANLLSSLPSVENFDPLTAYSTKYSYDGDAVYAHVQVPVGGSDSGVSTGLRLVFRWEAKSREGFVQGNQGGATNADNWKYHDAKPMPFPPSTHGSPQEALHPHSTAIVEKAASMQISLAPSIQLLPSTVPKPHYAVVGSDSDDDAYWDSYGRSSSDNEDDENGTYNYPRTTANKESDDEKAEDAYWAQYATVHGTADSTRHTPLLRKHKLHDPSEHIALHSSPDVSSYFDRFDSQELLAPDARRLAAYDSYGIEHIEHIHHFSTSGEGRDFSPVKGAPCPAALTRRLHSIGLRIGHSSSPTPLEGEVEPIKVGRPGLENLDSADSESPDTSDGQTLTPPGNSDHIPEMHSFVSVDKRREDNVDSGLHEALRGIYKLWTVTRKSHPVDKGAPDQKDEFMNIVREVLNSTQ